MIEEAFQTYLSSDSGIAAMVGTPTRIYGLIMPQNTKMPCVVYLKVGDYPVKATYCGPDIQKHCVFQFDSYAKTYKDALLLSASIKAALIGFTGVMGDTRVSSVSLETELQMTDPEPGLFRVSTTFDIWYAD